MSTSPEFIEHILDILHPVGDINVSRMFGGALLKVEGEQLGVLFEDTIFFKVVEPELQKKFKHMGSKQFTYTRKDKLDPVIIKNWWSAPEGAIDDEKELVRLAELVLTQKK